MEGMLTFRLLTPRKEVVSCSCDAVDLWAKDDEKGCGGGSVGIRPGHVRAVVALAEDGLLKVISAGKIVFAAKVRGGFARIEGGAVTVLTPSAEVTTES